jgi:acyl-coenzyme A synthetase/AMP-(fatty) acid ligase
MAGNIFEQHLDKTAANYAPLTPLSFLERAAYVYPQRVSVIHGAQRYTWSQTYARARQLASALARRGVGVGDTVAAMLPNIPAMYEAHFGVPMCGAVLNTQHAAGWGGAGLHARAWRGQDSSDRYGVFSCDRKCAGKGKRQKN